jgi:hypothetical protein
MREDTSSNQSATCRRCFQVGSATLVALLATSLMAQAAQTGSTDPWGASSWEWRLGPACRIDTRVEAVCHADAIAARVKPFLTRRSSGDPDVGSLDEYANRDYADGFVYIDPGTDDPETDTPGLTWYWGYDNPEQYTGNSVVFHSELVDEIYVVGQPMDSWFESDQMDLFGIDFSVGRRLWHKDRLAVGLCGGVSWYPERSTGFSVRRMAALETATTWRYVDTYSAPYKPFPRPPYAGSFEGPGYLLSNQPDSRDVETLSSVSSDWVAESMLDVDISLFGLRLGPSLWWAMNDRLMLRLTPQVRAAYVEAEAVANMLVTPTSAGPMVFCESDVERDWLLGGGVEAEVSVMVSRNWLAAVSAAADWWSDDITVSAEPFSAAVELGQWTFTASLGREF